ncbi:MAG: hypothetical protein AAF747_05085 [Planctomycetota bacterium]
MSSDSARTSVQLPSIGLINLSVFGAFMLVAGVGSLVPSVVRDRLPESFRPLWRSVLTASDSALGPFGEALAVMSQWIIGITEFVAGAAALAAVFVERVRGPLAKLGLGLATSLIGTFMVVLFLLHEPALPKWTQYPPLLVWFAATWLLLEHEAGRRFGGG